MPEIIITNRSDRPLSAKLEGTTKAKLESVSKLDPSLIQIEAVFDHSGNESRSRDSHKVEITAYGSGTHYVASAKSHVFFRALDDAVEKIRRQLRKTKDQRTVAKSGHRKPESIHDVAAAPVAEED